MTAAPAQAPSRATGIGAAMHSLMSELFPICRSITGPGVRETLQCLARHIPLRITEVPSGTRCFDWTIPDEWSVRDAYIADMAGKRLIDFRVCNLHVLSYSEPVDQVLTFEELRPYLYTRPDLPDAVPYLTSYYQRRWGFCLSENQKNRLGPGPFRVRIDSTLAPGALTYGEMRLEGESDEEILLSTYVCHPSMANNELSGPVLTTFLARHLMAQPQRRFTYRIVFAPETIGALCYLSRNLAALQEKVVAGYIVTCVGGPGGPTYLSSRSGDAPVDRVTRHVLAHCGEDYRLCDFTARGSDERQYGAPGVDLPVGSLMRAKYGDYPQYHTSLDDLAFVTPDQLERSFDRYVACLEALEKNRRYRVTTLGEPNLGRRGLYPTLGGQAKLPADIDAMMALLGYCDGRLDLIDIAQRHARPVWDFYPAADALVAHGLLGNA